MPRSLKDRQCPWCGALLDVVLEDGSRIPEHGNGVIPGRACPASGKTRQKRLTAEESAAFYVRGEPLAGDDRE